MKYLLPIALAMNSPAIAQCPANSTPHFDCLSSSGNTQIPLFADAETGPSPSTIAGPITADGPFSLLLTRGQGLNISDQGSITAPSIFISALPALSSDTYQGSTRARQLTNTGNITASSGDLSILAYQFTNNGQLSSSSENITLISTGSETISGPNFQRSPTPNHRESNHPRGHRNYS